MLKFTPNKSFEGKGSTVRSVKRDPAYKTRTVLNYLFPELFIKKIKTFN